MPIGLAGLMLVVRNARGRGGALAGLCFGLGLMLPLVRWITVIGFDAWVALALLEASFYALTGMAWAWLRPMRIWPVACASVWVGSEWMRGAVPFGGLPWGRLAFGLVESHFVRYGRVGGTALVSFVVVLVVGLAVAGFERRRDRGASAAVLLPALALIALGMILPVGPASPVGTARVAAVQGNVPGEGMDPFSERRAVLDNHARATRDYAADVAAGDRPAPDLVIWPENSSDIDPFSVPSAFAEIDRAVKAVGVPTLVGAIVDGPDAGHVQNMGIVWDPVEGPGATYSKRHPVPFGEYIPFRGLLSRVTGRLDQIPRDMFRGSRVGVLDVGGVAVGDVMCFEVAYDGLVRSVIEGGGQMLVVQTNNATYAGTGQLEQQFAISRYRAIETGRSVVVAATNGISGFVSPDGSVMVQSDQNVADVLAEEVTLAGGVTWGVRLGFWVEAGLSLAGLAFACRGGVGARARARAAIRRGG